ncbi:hypothetical protein BNJ_00201 [Kaumoebavirus]|uniref:hypothetical protein n=1 Tax=Kaumoebavirus TaxID=1859492 RepID=UPI0009C303AE|nr:hypothetical protein BNJ_00201 [Kaumoebavirus]ARA72032.1 hypothetical protein BNJ_00201 [Kaumoebavirus]
MSSSIWEYSNVIGQLHASFPYFTYLVNGDSLAVFYSAYKVTTLSVRKDLSLFECGYSLCWDGHSWNVMRTAEEAVDGALDLITDSPVFSPYHLIEELKREISELKKAIHTPAPVASVAQVASVVDLNQVPAVVYEEDNPYETPVASPQNNIEWEEIDA